MDEDELFGEDDLYGDAYGQDGQTYGDEQDAYMPGQVGTSDNAGHQTHGAGNQGQKGSDPEDRVKALQNKLMESLVAADRWRTAFKEVATASGFTIPLGREPDVPSVMEAVQRTRMSEQSLQEEVKALRRKEAALQIQLAERSLENTELRRELHAAWQASDPNVVQLKQLLLDPALNKEFNRLKGELEEAQKELKHVQEELSAINFTQESKIGRQLMAKCRSLQEENEEMARELSEGKRSQVETQLAMAKDFADEMRSSYLELQDHCRLLDDEAEQLQREVFALRRQVRELEGDVGGGGSGPHDFHDHRPRGGGGIGGRGFRGRGSMGIKRPIPGDRDGPPPPPRFLGVKRMR